MKLYIAASSGDLARAEKWHRLADLAGIEVVSTWPKTVRENGAGNPADADDEQRRKWVLTGLFETNSANTIWLLAPPDDQAARGAFFEIGYAYSREIGIVVSGPTARASIFTSLGTCHETDDEGFAEVCRRATQGRRPRAAAGR